MTLFRPSTNVEDRTNADSPQGQFRADLRIPLATVIAAAIVATGLLNGQGSSVRGDDRDSAKSAPTEAGPASLRAFVSEIQQALKQSDDRLVELAAPIVDKAEAFDQFQDQLVGLESHVRSAELHYRVAQVQTEIARMTLNEYEKVTYPQEESEVQFEVQSAQAELERARKAIPEAKERLARIGALMKDQSDFNRYMEDEYSTRLTSAQVQEKKVAFVLDAAQSKQRVLEQYTKSKTLKELNSEVHRALSEELTRQATWELEKTKLAMMKKTARRSKLAEFDRRILSLVQKAYPIQASIEARLNPLVKSGKSDPALEKALCDLTNQLEALVDQAEGEWAPTQFAQLIRQIRGSRSRGPGLFGALFGKNPSGPVDRAQAQPQQGDNDPQPALHHRHVAADQRSLNGVYVRLIDLIEQALEAPRSSRLRDQLVNQRIATESAKAGYQNARMAREIAEIAVTEYTEGIFKIELESVEGEIRLAHSDLRRSQDLLESGKVHRALTQGHVAKSVYELHRQYQFDDAMARTEQDHHDRAHQLLQAEMKKKRLVENIRPLKVKKLQNDVEKARAAELAKQAEWESAKAREARLNTMIQREDSVADNHRAVLAIIERAIPIEEQIREKLGRLTKAAKSDDPLHKEIQDLTKELRAILDEGEALWAASQFAELKPRIEAAVHRAAPAAAK